MRPPALEKVALVCPRCRAHGPQRLRLAEAARAEADEVLEGVLVCPGCAARYPIADGVPAVFRDLGAWLESAGRGMLLRPDLAEPVAAILGAALADDALWNQRRAELSTWGGSHWGDLAGLDGPFDGAQDRPPALLADARRAEGPLRIDLGCGPGRLTFEAARGAELSVGLDVRFEYLRLAAAAARGRVSWPRRLLGRAYARAEADTRALSGLPVLFVAGDALDPPFEASAFATVAAWNLLDNVRVPFHLLGQADALLAPGGLLLLSSPYSWRSGTTDEGERLGEADSPAALRDILTGRAPGPVPLRYTVEEERDHVPWRLRQDARVVTELTVHLLRARKGL